MSTYHKPEWSGELQDALGLGGKALLSLEVTLRVADDEVLTGCVSYVEFLPEEMIREITRCLSPVEFNEVTWKSKTRRRKPSEIEDSGPMVVTNVR